MVSAASRIERANPCPTSWASFSIVQWSTIKPSFADGIPNRARGPTTRRSQASASWQPAPSAGPSTAATVQMGSWLRTSSVAAHHGGRRGVLHVAEIRAGAERGPFAGQHQHPSVADTAGRVAQTLEVGGVERIPALGSVDGAQQHGPDSLGGDHGRILPDPGIGSLIAVLGPARSARVRAGLFAIGLGAVTVGACSGGPSPDAVQRQLADDLVTETGGALDDATADLRRPGPLRHVRRPLVPGRARRGRAGTERPPTTSAPASSASSRIVTPSAPSSTSVPDRPDTVRTWFPCSSPA